MNDRVIYWLKDDPELGYGSLSELQDNYDGDMDPVAPAVHQVEKAVYLDDVFVAVSLDPDDPDCSLVTEHATKEEAEAELAERIAKLEAERPIEERIDRLLHDAEHAEAGADFAARMARTNPSNPDHAKYRDELHERAKRLRGEARVLLAERDRGVLAAPTLPDGAP